MNGLNLANITGLFLGGNEYTKMYYGSTLIWQKGSGPTPPTPHDYEKDYFTTVSQGSGNIIYVMESGSPTIYLTSISYSTDDGSTWTTTNNVDGQEVTVTVPVSNGDKVLWKGNGRIMRYTKFNATTNFSVEGNIMSLLNGDNFYQSSFYSTSTNNFRELFSRCTYLVDAANLVLPATTLTNYCYCGTFEYCSNLITSPKILPATTLTAACYYFMFAECTNLTTSPELPATKLEQSCYRQMFDYCTKLNYVKCLATDISASNCLYNWLRATSQTGILYKKAGVTYPSGSSGKPSGWTVVNV